MSEESAALRGAFERLNRAIGICFKDRQFGPGLMLLYATIDAFASVCADRSLNLKNNEIFRNWVDRYYRKHLNSDVTANELWKARCGLLHAYSPIPDDPKFRTIEYSTEDLSPDLEKWYSPIAETGARVTLSVSTMHAALVSGFNDMKGEMAQDLEFAQRVNDGASKFLKRMVHVNLSADISIDARGKVEMNVFRGRKRSV